MPNRYILAIDKYTLLEPVPCIEGVGNCKVGELQNEISFSDYVGYLFKFAIAFAVFAAIIVIIYGGFEYMLSEAVPAKLDAKGRIQNAIKGLVLVFASYLILRTIDPRLVQVYSEIPPVNFKVNQETKDFQDKLTRDIQTLSAESQAKVKQTNDALVKKQTRIDELSTKNVDTGLLSDEEYKELNDLQQQANADKSLIVRESAKEKGMSILSKADAILSDPSNLSPDAKTFSDKAKQDITALKIEMELAYNDYAQQLKNYGDLEGSQKVAKQIMFYSTRIDEEQQLLELFARGQNGLSKVDTIKLQSFQVAYVKVMQDPKKFVPDDPELQVIYKKIAQDRTQRIINFYSQANQKK